MCWVALDRAARLAEIRGDSELQARWQEVADEIKADILEHGVSDAGVLRQHYETDSLDASVLLAALAGFLPGDDERMRATVLAIADDLTENGFVLATAPTRPTTGSRARRARSSSARSGSCRRSRSSASSSGRAI